MNGLPIQDSNDPHCAGADSTIPSADRAHAGRMLSLSRTARPAPSIPDYELLRLIGFGNYGEVWLARNALGSFRAVKFVYRESFDNDRPFDREFQGLKQFEPISHARESQVDIFHVGRNEAAGYFYYVMELADAVKVQGADSNIERDGKGSKPAVDFENWVSDLQAYIPRTLKYDLRTRGALPVSEGLQIGLSLVRALEHLHGHGLVHRDIKPSNIIFVKGVPKLADIGLVTSVDATRSFVGTDGYIAPEGPGTPQADLYSLGKVLYEMLTGKDRLDFPELPGDWRTSPEFDQIVEFNEIWTKACEDDATRRYQAAAEIKRDLELLQSGKSLKQERRREARWILGRRAISIATFGLVVVGGMLIVARQLLDPSGSADNAPVHFGLRSTNDHANELYDQGIYLMRADDQSRMAQAYTNFIEATRIDRRFVSPYVGLLEMQIREHFPGMPTNALTRIRTLATILNGLAPDLAATQLALSFGYWADMHYEQALNCCNRAIRLDPNYEFAHTHYAFMLLMMGRIQESNKEALKARKLAASKGVILLLPGHYYYYRRQYAQAIEQYREARDLQPDFGYARYWIGRALKANGDYVGGLNAIQESKILFGADEIETKARFDELRQAFNDSGASGYWHKELDLTEKEPDTDFYWKAVVRIQLGDTNGALHWLNKSFDTRERSEGGWTHDFEDVVFDECWDPYRGESWFKMFVDKIGFERVALPR